ncbi:hypothetical protein [Vibrio crassostreae]|uniref:hypothetical protein n=1 Tax=Vibrio crassostreae TaxID=246167 RepID=UPI001B30806B|nr:hypothetical protein [Vibrio crassostreae]
MMEQDEPLTQKDLLKILVDQEQYRATREARNRGENTLIKRIDVFERTLTKRIDTFEYTLTKRMDGLEQKIDDRFSTLKTTVIVSGISSVIVLAGLMIALAQMLNA